jgi:hypothetical protein
MSKIHNNTSEPCQNLESESGKSFQSVKEKRKELKKKGQAHVGLEARPACMAFFIFLKNKIHR